MNTPGFLIGMILLIAVGLWMAFTLAEMILVILGYIIAIVGIAGVVKYIFGMQRGTRSGL